MKMLVSIWLLLLMTVPVFQPFFDTVHSIEQVMDDGDAQEEKPEGKQKKDFISIPLTAWEAGRCALQPASRFHQQLQPPPFTELQVPPPDFVG